ncbi:MAG: TerB family tellurite resistance protein [Flavobacteriales bacterium]|nr:TerB family tellurite resistance protein [Flavobacteriales bacterium]
MNHQLFYKELGRLLYAIAAVDGRVSKAEIDRLHDVVSRRLVPLEPATDKYGTDQAYITEFEFDVLADQGADPGDMFDSFVSYISQHRKEVAPELRDLILELSDQVAHAFHGVNKEELALLIELRKELR